MMKHPKIRIRELQKLHPEFKKAYKDNDWDTYYKLLKEYRHEEANKR